MKLIRGALSTVAYLILLFIILKFSGPFLHVQILPLILSKVPTHLSLLKTLKDDFLVIVQGTGQVQTPFSESSIGLKWLLIDLGQASRSVLGTDLVYWMVWMRVLMHYQMGWMVS